jgi:hypothetical protein
MALNTVHKVSIEFSPCFERYSRSRAFLESRKGFRRLSGEEQRFVTGGQVE